MDADKFLSSVRDAAFAELNQHLSFYNPAEQLEISLEVVKPENFQNIIGRSHARLVELGMEAVSFIYHDKYVDLDEVAKLAAIPSNKMYKIFNDSVLANVNKVDIEIGYYRITYNAFLEKLNKARSLGRSIGGAALGGAIGSLLGPIGALIGSVAVGAISDGNANDELKDICTEMDNAVHRVVSSVNSFLEEMASIVLENVGGYHDALCCRIPSISKGLIVDME